MVDKPEKSASARGRIAQHILAVHDADVTVTVVQWMGGSQIDRRFDGQEIRRNIRRPGKHQALSPCGVKDWVTAAAASHKRPRRNLERDFRIPAWKNSQPSNPFNNPGRVAPFVPTVAGLRIGPVRRFHFRVKPVQCDCPAKIPRHDHSTKKIRSCENVASVPAQGKPANGKLPAVVYYCPGSGDWRRRSDGSAIILIKSQVGHFCFRSNAPW